MQIRNIGNWMRPKLGKARKSRNGIWVFQRALFKFLVSTKSASFHGYGRFTSVIVGNKNKYKIKNSLAVIPPGGRVPGQPTSSRIVVEDVLQNTATASADGERRQGWQHDIRQKKGRASDGAVPAMARSAATRILEKKNQQGLTFMHRKRWEETSRFECSSFLSRVCSSQY